MPPEKRYSFMKDYTNVIGWNIRKTNKMNPTFIFPSSIRIFKSTSCFRDVKELICNCISCFEFAILERKSKLLPSCLLPLQEKLRWELQGANHLIRAVCPWFPNSPCQDPLHPPRYFTTAYTGHKYVELFKHKRTLTLRETKRLSSLVSILQWCSAADSYGKNTII